MFDRAVVPQGTLRTRALQVFVPFMCVVPHIVRLMDWVRPGIGSPAYLPSSLLRYITFKLTMDLDRIPGLSELTR